MVQGKGIPMKKVVRMMVGMTIASISASATAGPLSLPLRTVSANEYVPLSVETIFVPKNFDARSPIVIFLDGHLPDTCYDFDHYAVLRDNESLGIEVDAFGRRNDSDCTDTEVPFSVQVPLGHLSEGHYAIKSGEASELLDVSRGFDLLPYERFATIDTVDVVHDQESWRYHVVVSGRYTDSCGKLSSVQFIDSGKTKELRLIIRHDPTSNEPCHSINTSFSIPIALPTNMAPGRYLVHVRSENNAVIGKVFTVEESRAP